MPSLRDLSCSANSSLSSLRILSICTCVSASSASSFSRVATLSFSLAEPAAIWSILVVNFSTVSLFSAFLSSASFISLSQYAFCSASSEPSFSSFAIISLISPETFSNGSSPSRAPVRTAEARCETSCASAGDLLCRASARTKRTAPAGSWAALRTRRTCRKDGAAVCGRAMAAAPPVVSSMIEMAFLTAASSSALLAAEASYSSAYVAQPFLTSSSIALSSARSFDTSASEPSAADFDSPALAIDVFAASMSLVPKAMLSSRDCLRSSKACWALLSLARASDNEDSALSSRSPSTSTMLPDLLSYTAASGAPASPSLAWCVLCTKAVSLEASA
mmetsp:Transcript_52495/g.120029  ORF Transcript_52495/g.120029 Transcript_52495/m.120029 type:complete len:334 (-) Transcript_52495:600-1601(-)